MPSKSVMIFYRDDEGHRYQPSHLRATACLWPARNDSKIKLDQLFQFIAGNNEFLCILQSYTFNADWFNTTIKAAALICLVQPRRTSCRPTTMLATYLPELFWLFKEHFLNWGLSRIPVNLRVPRTGNLRESPSFKFTCIRASILDHNLILNSVDAYQVVLQVVVWCKHSTVWKDAKL
jgi:hypothetical protein